MCLRACFETDETTYTSTATTPVFSEVFMRLLGEYNDLHFNLE